MDYEKKYNEALAKAKAYFENENYTEMADVFPELTESEDEQAMRIIRKRMCYDQVPISDEDRRIVEAWLERQKEQKPAEWSEEDELMILKTLEMLGGRGTTGMQIDWLKFLRPQPHWKPSEEQMSMLLAVIRDPNNAGSESCFLAFKSLYEDLKKL